MAAITMPCADAALAFTAPGRVETVKVHEGDDVEAGALLAELDARVLDTRIATLRAEAETDVPIRAAVAEHAQRKNDAEKITAARAKGGASPLEVEHARLEAEIAAYRHEIAENDKKIAGLKLDEALAERVQLRLFSPIAGRVEKIAVEPGEAIQALEPAVRVVCVDPLWAEAPVPLKTLRRLGLRKGDRLPVVFPGEGDAPEAGRATGEVIFIALAGDSASETAKVRVAIPNPDKRQSGERVRLFFQEKDKPIE